MESLGTSLIESVMVLVQFVPILFGLSLGIPIFFFGDWQYGLITGALLWTLGGTAFLIGLDENHYIMEQLLYFHIFQRYHK